MKFMRTFKYVGLGVGILMAIATASYGRPAQVVASDGVIVTRRDTVAIRYSEGQNSTIELVGTRLAPTLIGKAEVKRQQGRTRIKLEMKDFANPQALGPFYTTYVLWAISPEGRADSLAEMPFKRDSNIEVTTALQTFALIITAEPYSAVKLPSPVIVAENQMRSGTKGVPETSKIQYRGDAGTFYAVSTDEPSMAADYNTPLVVLGAHRAVAIAKRAGARKYDEEDFHQAEVKLAVLDQTWPENRKAEEKLGGQARDIMQLAEHAREVSVERDNQSRLSAERQEARSTIAQSKSEAEQARSDANQAQSQAAEAQSQAAQAQDEAARAKHETEIARQRVQDAQTEADKAKANEELARAQAEQSRIDADQARSEKEAAEQQLYISLSAILETKREARGLVVSLSDVLFDFNKATLKPGARERLAKLAGVLIAYPGPYRMEIDGFTDSVGTDEYNLKLSQDRADTVQSYLVEAGVHTDRISQVKGMGKMTPVATNDTAEGRQMNRRVEIVISDLSPSSNPTAQQ
jgi:outer membrane protein OmpA-like peptidoglycan-associated protein